MTKNYKWTNKSVLEFSNGSDPVATMESRARELALTAMDNGWSGPPFDPLVLAEQKGIRIEARGDIPDARLVPIENEQLVLQYNPTRPRGRLRFSIAHEIAHTLFPDCGERVRNREPLPYLNGDNWQLEVLCNIGAAELLMPSGSFTQLAKEPLSIQKVMDIRKDYDVSVEACLIRLIKLTRSTSAAFCASAHDGGNYRVDYVIPSLGYDCPVTVGQPVPLGSAVLQANAIGFTAIGKSEIWGETSKRLRVECVGLAPYAGGIVPRVVGFLFDSDQIDYSAPEIIEVDGNALQPRGSGFRIVAHVIPDTNKIWGGNGFASQLRRKFPRVWSEFENDTLAVGHRPALGEIFRCSLDESVAVVHMVAQRGIGPSKVPRLQYSALAKCLTELREQAQKLDASVHMPRIGTGHGGAAWSVVRELIEEELVNKGISTTVYRLPV